MPARLWARVEFRFSSSFTPGKYRPRNIRSQRSQVTSQTRAAPQLCAPRHRRMHTGRIHTQTQARTHARTLARSHTSVPSQQSPSTEHLLPGPMHAGGGGGGLDGGGGLALADGLRGARRDGVISSCRCTDGSRARFRVHTQRLPPRSGTHAWQAPKGDWS